MSTVDGAAIFLGMTPRNDLTADFRSATMRRNAQLPQTLPANIKAELETRDDYARLTKELEFLEIRIRTARDEMSAQQIREERSQLYCKRRMLEQAALKRYQDSQVGTYLSRPAVHEHNDWRKDHFERIRHMRPEIERLTRTLGLRVPLRSPEGIPSLRDLIAIRKSDCQVAYQTCLQPLNGCCPVVTCRKEIKE